MRIIPNQNTWVGFSPTLPANLDAPSVAEVGAATTVTGLLVTINAGSTGNTVPTPALDSLFETSVPGTSAAQFTADFYRDDDNDVAWNLLPRGTEGVFYIKRFGGTGTERRPGSTQDIEVWPVQVTSRTAGPLTSNTAQTFTVTCSVPQEPHEDAVVAA